MELQQGLFAVKLRELEREYGRLQSRIHLFQEKRSWQVQQELDRLQDEYQEQALLLEEYAQSSHSPVMAALAQAQLDYNLRVEKIFNDTLPNPATPQNQSVAWDHAETITLFAECAIDFATQSMRQALIAALTAILLQQQTDPQAIDHTSKGGNINE